MKKFEQIEKTLNELYLKYLPCMEGKTASYIPELDKADPTKFAIAVVTAEGSIYSAGDIDQLFTLQSVSKPFIYGLALETHGREVLRKKVGMEPTGDAFNSIIELEEQTHRPYNPMINSGAIAVSSLIKDDQRVLDLIASYTGHTHTIDQDVFNSEKLTAHRNRAIANLLLHFNIIDQDIEHTLDLYFKQCSVLTNTVDLALMAATLANRGVQPITHKKILSPEHTKDMLSLMFTCGMYDTAGEWAYTVGLPAKSGVSGGLIAVVPGVMGIAVYSPLIDQHGHSVRALKVFNDLAQIYQLSVFL